MTWRLTTAGSMGRRAAMLGLLVLAGTSAPRAEQSGAEALSVKGVWYVQVTVRDCTTGVPLAPPVHSLVTFAAGGTLHESVSGGGFAVGQRSDGHGTWAHKGGRTYDQRFVSLINFTTPPGPGPVFEAGWMKVNHTIEMVDADHIESSGGNSFYRRDGSLYRSGCSTAVGTRFE